jgi:hypothetical protein
MLLSVEITGPAFERVTYSPRLKGPGRVHHSVNGDTACNNWTRERWQEREREYVTLADFNADPCTNCVRVLNAPAENLAA